MESQWEFLMTTMTVCILLIPEIDICSRVLSGRALEKSFKVDRWNNRVTPNKTK